MSKLVRLPQDRKAGGDACPTGEARPTMDARPADFLRVVAAPHPFRMERYILEMRPGQTLLELLAEIQPDSRLRQQAFISIDGRVIPADLWAHTIPRPENLTLIRVVPRNRGIAMIFVAIAAIFASILVPGLGVSMGLWAAGSMMGTIVGGLAGLTVGVVGGLLANALIPPPRPSARGLSALSQAGAADAPTNFVSGARNQMIRWGTIASLLGYSRIVPLKMAEDYTETEGDDQYVRCWFGQCGPLEMSDVKIGETAFSEFEGVEAEFRQGFPDDDPVTIYTRDVHEEVLSVLLEHNQPQVRTSQTQARELSVDLTFPNGLYSLAGDGSRTTKTCVVKIEYRPAGSGDYILAENLSVTAATSSAVRRGKRWTVAEGQYDVRLTRLTAPDSTMEMSVCYWTALRSVKEGPAITFPDPLAQVAVRIKASNQLHGTLDEFNFLGKSIFPDWDAGTETWIERITNNPASLYRAVLQGAAAPEAIADGRIDLNKLAYWHEYCVTHGFAYNRNIDQVENWWGLLAEIAAAGRAAPGEYDGKWSVVLDELQTGPVPIFNPRTMKDLEVEIVYPDLPHAFRCPFKNEENDYQDDERLVLDDGYQIDGLDAWGNPAPTLPPATKFEQMELRGCTNSDLIFKHARYHIADARLRFRKLNFMTNIQHLASTRGDKVLLAHDVMLVGLAYGRVKALHYDQADYLSGVTLDEVMPMQAGLDYGLQFRLADLTTQSLHCQVVTDPGGYSHWSDLGQQFTQTYIFSLAYLENGICLAGTYIGGKILRSTDYGQSWTDLGQQYSQTSILALAYLGNGICLAGTGPDGKILRSTDYGQSWTDLGQQYSQTYIYSLICLEDGICLAGTGSGGKILRSTDWGQSWTDLGQQYSQASILALAYLGNGICLAGTGPNGKILRSTDYGLTWSDLGQQYSQIRIYSLAYVGNGICLAGTYDGGKILRSTDYGLTWSDLGQQFSQTYIYSLACLESGVCLAGTGPGGKILRSTDYGLTWENLGQQYSQASILALAYLGTGICMAGTDAGGKILRAVDVVKTVYFVDPIATEDPRPAVGDLATFGEFGLETIPVIIKAIEMRGQLWARIRAVDEAPAIHDADQGTIPAFVSKISAPAQWWTPIIESVRSDGSVLARDADGSWLSRILVSFRRITAVAQKVSGVEAQFWRSDSAAGPVVAVTVPLDAGEVALMPVEDGVSYKLRLRYVKEDWSRGPWSAIETHVVEGKTAPPADVTGFAMLQVRENVNGTWTAVPDRDLAGYEIRYGAVAVEWDDGAVLTKVMMGTSFTTPILPPGTYDFMIKAIDTTGNYSDTEARKTFQVIMFYTVLSDVLNAPVWAGTLTNYVRNPLTGHLNPQDQNLASGDNFNVFDNYVVNPYATATYEAPEIDLGENVSGRAWARIYSDLGPGESGEAAPVLWLDYKLDGGSYDGFEEWTFGAVSARYVKFKLINTAAVGLGRLTQFETIIDKAL
jgi:photosystem II stability/assembly factor-like uncharacterized protein